MQCKGNGMAVTSPCHSRERVGQHELGPCYVFNMKCPPQTQALHASLLQSWGCYFGSGGGGSSRNFKRLSELEDLGHEERFCEDMFSNALVCLSLFPVLYEARSSHDHRLLTS